MSNDRSPDSPAPADTAPAWADDSGEGRELPQQRGLLGRILDAFSGNEPEPEAVDRQQETSGARGSALGMLNLRRMRVDDVAIPKAEIVAVPVSTSLPELVEIFREHGFSRIPVYRDTLDAPLGQLHLKDLALKFGFGADAPPFALQPMLRPLLYVPPSMQIGVLLQQMQQKRIHMALVIDEYGGVDGLVTIEDLIEQIIGEIEDEHDEIDGGLLIAEKPGQWLIEGRAELEDVEADTGLRLTPDEREEEIDTLGGLIVMLADRVPEAGETVTHASGAVFEIVASDPRRVLRVRLRMPPAPEN
ncbi:CBS domain-containing protein [Paracoccus limosus]|uniref:CBS domain-containing protein n=1 Tax=Paracoccus limosus TaxID=913252 RepID=A0A844GZ97_9RHOB|nr:hemolysin family protein [Paracoccus limosus]MTH33959.1 CBS domain-containing protein [Paracoccus limosus]